jgi:hypothetical protein
MKWRINIGARIGDHFDFTDLKRGALSIMLSGAFPGQIVADFRPRQARICDHTVFNDMAEFKKFRHGVFLIVSRFEFIHQCM